MLSHLLRGHHVTAPVIRDRLGERELRVAGSRREIHHQVVQLAPFHIREGWRTAPATIGRARSPARSHR